MKINIVALFTALLLPLSQVHGITAIIQVSASHEASELLSYQQVKIRVGSPPDTYSDITTAVEMENGVNWLYGPNIDNGCGKVPSDLLTDWPTSPAIPIIPEYATLPDIGNGKPIVRGYPYYLDGTVFTEPTGSSHAFTNAEFLVVDASSSDNTKCGGTNISPSGGGHRTKKNVSPGQGCGRRC